MDRRPSEISISRAGATTPKGQSSVGDFVQLPRFKNNIGRTQVSSQQKETMKLTKLNFKKKDQKRAEEKIVEMFLTDIVLDPEFQKMHRERPRVKERILESIRREGYLKDHPLLLAWIDGILVLIDGYQRNDCAIEAGLFKVWVIVRSYENRAEALLAARWAQLNRRNNDLGDFFHALENNLLSVPAHRPKSTPIGVDFGVESDPAKEGRLKLKVIADAHEIKFRTAQRYLSLLQADENGVLKRAKADDITYDRALQLIRKDLKGRPKPRKLSDEKVLTTLLADPSVYGAWIDHCGGITRACDVFRAFAQREMSKFSPPPLAQKETNPSETPLSSGESLPDGCPLSPVSPIKTLATQASSGAKKPVLISPAAVGKVPKATRKKVPEQR
jgi:hypothetical protein